MKGLSRKVSVLSVILNVVQSLVIIVWSYATLKWYRREIMDSIEAEILARLHGVDRCELGIVQLHLPRSNNRDRLILAWSSNV